MGQTWRGGWVHTESTYSSTVRDASTRRADEASMLCSSSPSPTNTHPDTHSHTCIYPPSDRPGTNHNGTMTYKPHPHGNYSQAFKSDSIKSQQQQQQQWRKGVCTPPKTCILAHHHLMSPLQNKRQAVFVLNMAALFPTYCTDKQAKRKKGDWEVGSIISININVITI